MLGWRLAVSAILIPALIGIFWLDAYLGGPAGVLLLFCLLLAVRAAWELVDLLRVRSFEPSFPRTAILSCLVICAAWVPARGFPGGSALDNSPWQCIVLAYAVAVLVIFLSAALNYREPGKSMETVGAELLIVSYVGVLLGVTAQLRFLGRGEVGYLALGSLVIAAKSGDIGAYTLGRLFGKRKMVPLLSPGKTWMGGLGAIIGAALGSWLWFTYAPSWFEAVWQWQSGRPDVAIVFGAIIGAVGLVGDLAESLIKRDVGRKDSAALMPGFGGLLDLLDSVLYAGPVAYILWLVLPLLG